MSIAFVGGSGATGFTNGSSNVDLTVAAGSTANTVICCLGYTNNGTVDFPVSATWDQGGANTAMTAKTLVTTSTFTSNQVSLMFFYLVVASAPGTKTLRMHVNPQTGYIFATAWAYSASGAITLDGYTALETTDSGAANRPPWSYTPSGGSGSLSIVAALYDNTTNSAVDSTCTADGSSTKRYETNDSGTFKQVFVLDRSGTNVAVGISSVSTSPGCGNNVRFAFTLGEGGGGGGDILYGGSHRGQLDGVKRGQVISGDFTQRKSGIFVPRNYGQIQKAA